MNNNETQTLFSSDELNTDFSAKPAPDWFIDQTNISNAIQLPKDDFLKMQKKKGLYALKNIKHVNNNTGNVNCSEDFYNLLQKRSVKNIWTQIVASEYYGSWVYILFFWFLSVIWLIFGTSLLNNMQQEDLINQQLKQAKNILVTGAYAKDPSNASLRYPKGPLEIDIKQWYDIQTIKNNNLKLKKQYAIYEKTIEQKGKNIKKELSFTLKPLEREHQKQLTQITTIAKQRASKLLDSVKSNVKNMNPDTGMKYIQEAQKKAANILSVAEEDKGKLQKTFSVKIDAIEKVYKKKTDSLGVVLQQARQKTNTQIKSVPEYPYDVLGFDPERPQNAYNVLCVLLSLIGVIVGFFFFRKIVLIISDIDISALRMTESIKYTNRNLKLIAFPSKTSLTGRYDDRFKTVVHFNISQKAIEKIITVTSLHYAWNALVCESNFDLVNIQKSEKLSMYENIKPMFYIEQDKMVIIYSGLPQDLEEKPTSTPTGDVIL